MSENDATLPRLDQDTRTAREGCSVLLDINDGDRLVFARLTSGSKLKIGKKFVSLKPLIGCPYGSVFQMDCGLDGSCLSRCKESCDLRENVDDEDECRDNRSINDDNKAQSLSVDDIDAMKRKGVKGDEIITALIANSATFDKKTAFSQEKYRIKKQKKYAPKVKLRRPFSRSICEAYFKKYPARIGFLRVDALSLLLSMANATANSDVLVVDMVGGLVIGSVAERLGGEGYVCNAPVEGLECSVDIVKIFNFNSRILERIVSIPLRELCVTENRAAAKYNLPDGNTEYSNVCTTPVIDEGNASLNVSVDDEVLDLSLFSCPLDKRKGPKAGERPSLETLNFWKENGFSSMIIAAPDLDPWNVVKDLLPLLSFSAPFAVYHQYLEPLATCMHNLQMGKMAIGLQITEPWLRQYQVLPSRTHPMMQMSSFGGYILSGTKLHVT